MTAIAQTVVGREAAGFEAANKTVNDYGVSVCGFVFDQ